MATDVILRVNGTEYKQKTDEYNKYIQNEDGSPVPAGGGYVDMDYAIITAPNGISKIVIIGKHKRLGENTYTKEFEPPKDKLDFYGLRSILDYEAPSDFLKMEIQITEPTGGSEPEPETPTEPEPPKEKEIEISKTYIIDKSENGEGIEFETYTLNYEPPMKKENKLVSISLGYRDVYTVTESTVITVIPKDNQQQVSAINVGYNRNGMFNDKDFNNTDHFKAGDITNLETDSDYTISEITPTLEVKTIPEEPETPDTPTEPDSGNLFNIYNITKQNFIDLMGIDSIDESFTPIDNSYIIDFYNLPFNIDEIIHNTPTSIKYGKYDSKVQAKPVLKDKIKVDLGTIEIPLKYDNSYDYNVNQVLLYLPLTEPVELDYKYIINSKINISYEIDLNNHKTNLIIKSSILNNDIAYITNIDIIDSLLLINSKKERTDYKTRTTVYNHIKTPYIQIIRNTPYEKDSYYSSVTGQEQVVFKNLTGYNELIDIDLKFKCNNLEKQELKNILKSGFKIEK